MTDKCERLISNAHTALSNCKSAWGKNYWETVIKSLLRLSQRLN